MNCSAISSNEGICDGSYERSVCFKSSEQNKMLLCGLVVRVPGATTFSEK
jgi:hypothetical protein